jgi:hypothetical protein
LITTWNLVSWEQIWWYEKFGIWSQEQKCWIFEEHLIGICKYIEDYDEENKLNHFKSSEVAKFLQCTSWKTVQDVYWTGIIWHNFKISWYYFLHLWHVTMVISFAVVCWDSGLWNLSCLNFFDSLVIWTQDPMLARQTFYHLSHNARLFNLSVLWFSFLTIKIIMAHIFLCWYKSKITCYRDKE